MLPKSGYTYAMRDAEDTAFPFSLRSILKGLGKLLNSSAWLRHGVFLRNFADFWEPAWLMVLRRARLFLLRSTAPHGDCVALASGLNRVAITRVLGVPCQSPPNSTRFTIKPCGAAETALFKRKVR